ncbi:MAG: phospho-N-acetylmuramoyl-pentapeptide-transferase [Clostridia bacterium]|jgi:phospho-N-acetylmuramoyl-pentapeptide-transferase|nr:phospho-N-acetylmuramoyl-pentapeptide-transferase [Clostridia bacterium]
MIEYLNVEYNLFIISILSAFVLALVAGPVFIPLLHRLKFGQNVRTDGPQSHLKKTGTPAMGGLIFLLATVIVCLVFSKDKNMMLVLVSTLLFGLIGFADDYIKIVKKRSLGLRAWQKIAAQLAVAFFLAFVAAGVNQVGTSVLIPFTGKFFDFGIMYMPFIIFIIIGTVNSVNLTDGLDGLAGGVTVVVLGFFSVVALVSKNEGILVFSGALIGALLGFLRFNSHPAQVFMGDTGSLALGGAVASLAVMTKLSLFLAIIGAVYVAEALSVMIQVLYFKATKGKRFFKMSPLHHHFELSGWAESKVVSVFTIIAIILCLIGLLAI